MTNVEMVKSEKKKNVQSEHVQNKQPPQQQKYQLPPPRKSRGSQVLLPQHQLQVWYTFLIDKIIGRVFSKFLHVSFALKSV